MSVAVDGATALDAPAGDSRPPIKITPKKTPRPLNRVAAGVNIHRCDWSKAPWFRRRFANEFLGVVVPPPRDWALPLKTKLLFVCSRNQWRSPTAEALLKNHPRYEARSAGTENGARIKLTAGHVGWADLIFCMEKKHAARVEEKFAFELADKPLIVLRIPDDFEFMDPALVELLQSELAEHLEL